MLKVKVINIHHIIYDILKDTQDIKMNFFHVIFRASNLVSVTSVYIEEQSVLFILISVFLVTYS